MAMVSFLPDSTPGIQAQGLLSEQELVLDGTSVLLAAIAKTSRRMNRLVLVSVTQNQPVTTVIAITKGRAEDLKQTIDRLCSSRWAQLRQACPARPCGPGWPPLGRRSLPLRPRAGSATGWRGSSSS